MGLGLGDAGLLDEGALLEIQTRRVGVGGNEAQALREGGAAPAGGKERLAAEGAHEEPVPGIFTIALFRKAALDVGDGFAFGLAGGNELDIALGKAFHFLAAGGRGGIGFPGAFRRVGNIRRVLFHEGVLSVSAARSCAATQA